MTGGAVGIVNENGANRRLIRIVHRQLFETEIIDQFLTGFFGVGGRRTGPNHPRRQKRLFHVDVAPNLICIVLTALVANAAGWMASFRILGQKPLEVLRAE